jgi:hypothetical protein
MNECTPKEGTQMIRGRGRFVNRPGYSKKTKYPKYFIYVPVEVARDTAFPFKEGDEIEVIIDIDSKRLIIEKKK